MKLLFFLSCFVLLNCCCGKCPSKEVLFPCTCSDDIDPDGSVIICGGEEYYDMRKVFKSVSAQLTDDQKHFEVFIFNNTAIDVWEQDVFNDITFELIVTGVNYRLNLTRVATNALTASSSTLRSFASHSPALINDAPNYNIFEALNQCANIEQIYIVDSNITSIPSHAFSPLSAKSHSVQNKLTRIVVAKAVQTIGDYAFYELPNIEEIAVYGNLTSISSNAFTLKNPSNKTLTIALFNKFANFSLPEGVFSNAKRPLIIFLSHNKFTFLDEKVFSPFLNANEENKISVYLNPLNCGDCRNAWILKDKINLINRIIDAKCSDERNLFDVNFNCL